MSTKQLIIAIVSLCVSILLSVNAFFISRLITQLDANTAVTAGLQIKVAKLEQALQNKGYLEDTSYTGENNAWNGSLKSPDSFRPIGGRAY